MNQRRRHPPGSRKAGLPPGSLIHVGRVSDEEPRITILRYNAQELQEQVPGSLDELSLKSERGLASWILVEGLQDIRVVERLGRELEIHPLVLEDILNTHQRARFEEYDDHLYLVCKSPDPGNETGAQEQISLLVFDGLLITFKERRDPLLDPILHRLRTSRSRIVSLGPAFLAYAILDNIVDHYFLALDSLDVRITEIEDRLLAGNLAPEILPDLQRIRRELIGIRQLAAPVRELATDMLRSDSPLIDEQLRPFLRDVLDHATRVTESVELHREILTGLLEVYQSGLGNRMNEVMKVLTIFASIFIPLTFLAGVYGMNFRYMPELGQRWAYPALWGVFIAI
ncbi:MAG: magnesium/cobalt transporter CorA, partial [Anaerolineales bacterium]|nr:magnesium/cobalt transporter CorA [Anaerolineales bacterium]